MNILIETLGGILAVFLRQMFEMFAKVEYCNVLYTVEKPIDFFIV